MTAADIFVELVRCRPAVLEDLERIVGPLSVDPTESGYGRLLSRPGQVRRERPPEADFSADLVSVTVVFERLPPTESGPPRFLGSYTVLARAKTDQMAAAIEQARGATNTAGILAFPPFFLRDTNDGCALEWNPTRDLAREAQEQGLARFLGAIAGCDRSDQVIALATAQGWRETTSAKPEAGGITFLIQPALSGEQLRGALFNLHADRMLKVLTAGRSADAVATPPRLRAKAVDRTWELRLADGGVLPIGCWELRLFVEGEPWPGAPDIACDGRTGLGVVGRATLRLRQR